MYASTRASTCSAELRRENQQTGKSANGKISNKKIIIVSAWFCQFKILLFRIFYFCFFINYVDMLSLLCAKFHVRTARGRVPNDCVNTDFVKRRKLPRSDDHIYFRMRDFSSGYWRPTWWTHILEISILSMSPGETDIKGRFKYWI